MAKFDLKWNDIRLNKHGLFVVTDWSCRVCLKSVTRQVCATHKSRRHRYGITLLKLLICICINSVTRRSWFIQRQRYSANTDNELLCRVTRRSPCRRLYFQYEHEMFEQCNVMTRKSCEWIFWVGSVMSWSEISRMEIIAPTKCARRTVKRPLCYWEKNNYQRCQSTSFTDKDHARRTCYLLHGWQNLKSPYTVRHWKHHLFGYTKLNYCTGTILLAAKIILRSNFSTWRLRNHKNKMGIHCLLSLLGSYVITNSQQHNSKNICSHCRPIASFFVEAILDSIKINWVTCFAE